MISSSNQPHSTQTHSNCSSSSSSSIGEPSNAVTRNQINQFCVQSMPLQISQNNNTTSTMIPMNSTNNIHQQQQQQHQQYQQNQQQLLQNSSQYQGVMIECTYKNCTLNSKVISSKNHKSSIQENLIQQRYNNSNSINDTHNSEHSAISRIDNTNETVNKTTPILPPPLFDESGGKEVHRDTTIVSHEIIKTPSSSRRYHRTIPRHFTAVDPLVTNIKIADTSSNIQQIETNGGANTSAPISTTASAQSTSTNKKPTCQCPIQHVPMTYMGSNHFSATPPNNNVFLSTLSTKLINCKSNNTNTRTTSTPSSGKIHIISKQNIDNPTILTKGESHSHNGTLKRYHHHHNSNTSASHNSSNTGHSSINNNKIATISRHVIELKHDASNTGQIQSILKTPMSKEKNPHNTNGHNSSRNTQCGLNNGYKTCEEPFTSPFPIQFIDGISKCSSVSASNIVDSSCPENPILPPKMHKSSNVKQISNPIFVSKIHTITKPNNEIHQPIPPRTTSTARSSHHHSPLMPVSHYVINNSISTSVTTLMPNATTSAYTKSLPRKDEKITHALTLPNSYGPLCNAEKSQSLGKINSATYYPIQNAHATYTLPKQNNGKISLNSTITNVVSKVPSVISIPSSSSSSSPSTVTLLPSTNNNMNCTIENDQSNTSTVTTSSATNNTNSTKSSTLSQISNNHLLINTHTNLNNNKNNSNSIPSELINKSSKISQSSLPTENNSTKLNYLPKHTITNLSSVIINNSTNNFVKSEEKPLPVCTTSKNCSNPKEHFLPNDTSLDDEYLSECENCKTAHSSRYYLDKETEEAPPETMTLQRKMDDKEEEQTYYRTSLTLPTNTKKAA